MTKAVPRCALFLALVGQLCAPTAKAEAKKPLTPPASVPIQEWLAGPDRLEFAWQVQVVQTVTLQQRHLVQILATIRARDLLRGVSLRELHLVAKVADEQGHWLDGQSYTHFLPTTDFRKGDSYHAVSNFYLQPGNYTVALIAYDSLHDAGNLWRSKVSVRGLDEPLSVLGRAFPTIEFLAEAEIAPALKEHAPWSLFRVADLARYAQNPLALGHGTALLPIANKNPIRIDVIVNVSDNYQVLTQEQEPAWNYRYNEGLALQVGNLVSQLAPERGCVRVSVADILRQDLIVDRVASQRFDWDVVTGKVAAINLNKIGVASLREKETGIWFKQLVERVNDDNNNCDLPDTPHEHVVIVVSRAQSFPVRAHIEPVHSYLPQPRCYYLEFMAKNLSVNWDELERVLKPMSPQRLRFVDPDSLRRQVASLIKDLSEN